MCVAWLPKATVQAAVGGAALDLVVEIGLGPEARRHAETVLTLSVLVILLTAPLGAVGIAVAGPAWLEWDGPTDRPVSAGGGGLPDGAAQVQPPPGLGEPPRPARSGRQTDSNKQAPPTTMVA